MICPVRHCADIERVLDGVWRPRIGEILFYDVIYSQLVAIADRRLEQENL